MRAGEHELDPVAGQGGPALGPLGGLAVVFAVLLLNAALSFGSVWPTFAIRLQPEVSVELAALLLVLVAGQWLAGSPSQRLLRLCAAAFVLLVLGHYAAVMAHSLYGREINLYWDSQHVAALLGMFAGLAPLGLLLAALLAALLCCAALYLLGYWCLHRTARAMTTRGGFHALAISALAVVGLFVAQHATGVVSQPRFAPPVVPVYAGQAHLVAAALSGRDPLVGLAAPARLEADAARLAGADVLVMFLESYGAASYDRPEIATALAESRAELAAAIAQTGREVVSAFVRSPTFAGGSWLAHASFMSGIEVRDPGSYAALMAQPRDTLAAVMARQGYRTVGLMPGLRLEWPEGAFYGFDMLLDSPALDYRGPEFGWWRIPDQFALARFDQREFEQRERKPLFLLFTSISSHMPFLPTPPYQADWPRLLGEQPFDPDELARSLDQASDWNAMGRDYAQSMAYALTTVAGYLRKHEGREILLILLGDHQPAANVSGPDASWEVPVHVVASRPELLAGLLGEGFQRGLDPRRPAVGDLHTLQQRVIRSIAGTPAEAAEVASLQHGPRRE